MFTERSIVGVILVLALMLASCEKTDQGTIDSGGLPPAVRSAIIVPDMVNIDSLVPAGGLYSFQTTVRVVATDDNGDLSAVYAYLVGPKSSSQVADEILHDDGANGDVKAGDSIYTGVVTFAIPRSMAGLYRVQFVATDSKGFRSSTLDISLRVTRANSPPQLIDSTLSAPDTVVVPPTGTAVLLSIAATDSDGLADIQSVYFLSLDSSTPTAHIDLKDDGSSDPNAASGDTMAGDGIFSRIIAVPSVSSPRTFRFLFQAVDSFGDTSGSVLHYVTLR